jgi:hypothetical protein
MKGSSGNLGVMPVYRAAMAAYARAETRKSQKTKSTLCWKPFVPLKKFWKKSSRSIDNGRKTDLRDRHGGSAPPISLIRPWLT